MVIVVLAYFTHVYLVVIIFFLTCLREQRCCFSSLQPLCFYFESIVNAIQLASCLEGSSGMSRPAVRLLPRWGAVVLFLF